MSNERPNNDPALIRDWMSELDQTFTVGDLIVRWANDGWSADTIHQAIQKARHDFPEADIPRVLRRVIDRDVAEAKAAHDELVATDPDFAPFEVPWSQQRATDRSHAARERARAAYDARQAIADLDKLPPLLRASEELPEDVTGLPRVGLPGGTARNGLCGHRHNLVITGVLKSGKSNVMISLAARMTSAGRKFLERYEVRPVADGRTIVYSNFELTEADLQNWIDRHEPGDASRLVKQQLKGFKLPLMTDEGMAYQIELLKSVNAEVWFIDTWGELMRSVGFDENSNTEARRLLARIDEIKVAAGVENVVIGAHADRANPTRARGATAPMDWLEAHWALDVNDETEERVMASGRGRDTETFSHVLQMAADGSLTAGDVAARPVAKKDAGRAVRTSGGRVGGSTKLGHRKWREDRMKDGNDMAELLFLLDHNGANLGNMAVAGKAMHKGPDWARKTWGRWIENGHIVHREEDEEELYRTPRPGEGARLGEG